jgi:hypothetical protein
MFDVMWRAGLVLVFAACEKRPPPAPPPAPAPRDADIVIDVHHSMPEDAMPPTDALVTAEWPSAMEIVEHEKSKDGQTHSYYAFKTKPPELGKAMTTWMAPFKEKAGSKYWDEMSCSLSTASRIAVIGVCSTMPAMGDSGGAPAGPRPTYFAWWMQPGLPEVRFEELAPDVDATALIAKTIASSKASDCGNLEWCELTPEAFSLDSDGLHLVPGDYCSHSCELPLIPLDELKPTHPWGKKLVDWMKQSVEKGEPVVKYVVKKP